MRSTDKPSMRIPNDDHAIWSDVGGDDPAPIIAAARARDCIRLTQNNKAMTEAETCKQGTKCFCTDAKSSARNTLEDLNIFQHASFVQFVLFNRVFICSEQRAYNKYIGKKHRVCYSSIQIIYRLNTAVKNVQYIVTLNQSNTPQHTHLYH